MSCGCKQKPEPVRRQMSPVQIIEPSETEIPNYTEEELVRALNYLDGITFQPQERSWVFQFHNKHFREQLAPNCSQCIPRVKGRIVEMVHKLEEYRKHEKSNRKAEENPQ